MDEDSKGKTEKKRHISCRCILYIYNLCKRGERKGKIVKLALTRQFAYRRKSNRSFLHGLQCIYIVHSRI